MNAIEQMLKGVIGDVSPREFYRALYEVVPSAVRIGFRFIGAEGQYWRYNADLPGAAEAARMPITGVSIAYLTEDPENQGVGRVFTLEDFDEKLFWSTFGESEETGVNRESE